MAWIDEWGNVVTEPGELDPQLEIDAAEQRDYEAFRTGLTFGDVRRMLAVEQRQIRDHTSGYMFVSRGTVLGRWRELKLDMWRTGEPPPVDVECPNCGDLVELDLICADCGECLSCCQCEATPEDDFWRENPWAGTKWLIQI